ncbi:laccase lcc6 [Gymnopus androsaceus JB14]|uniref:Laccase lcc6 n=1 Tax=Gymnopus androsaceus JB14 TaxID=1447944 RepID=A0A6A4IC46_9AGAR|nr:laccase lcc6 [Gymnopus androsaceus JB14]
MLSAALLLLSPIGGALASIGPITDLPIVNAFLQPDGFNRSFVTAGGTIPGPTIVGNIGDNFQINVIDELTNGTMLLSTSIHWHGLFQATTNWADGAFVNQCPIAANNSFLYNFNVPGQAGTFWYHSHLATQYCDGLRGPLIIYDPDDPYLDLYDVDDDSTVITLSDNYHSPAGFIVGAAISDATLINGLGRYLTGPTDSPLAVISVTQGLRYRFRLVSISCDPNFVFSIDSHTFSFIEVDGVEHLPVTADSVQIFAAQRYSFVLKANQTVDNYWIKANPSTGNAGFTNGINSAILRYNGAPNAEPTTTGTPVNRLSETSLVPLVNPGASGAHDIDGADHNLNLQLGFNAGAFTINGVKFVPPSVPVLLQIISGALTPAELLPAGSVYALPLNSTIQLTFNTSTVAAIGGPHPFHLHGHNFDVIRPAGATEYNYDTPVRRDVVSTGSATDNVTIRFFTDNAGPWFLHCHIDFHLEAGFAIVFAEGAEEAVAPGHVPPPQAWDNLCPIYDALTPEQLGGGGGPTS